MDRTAILQAVARGWCSEANKHKEMDVDLATAIAEEIAAALNAQPKEARPLSEWCEDFGPVTWWKLPVEEAAWIGTPNDSDWPGYHTHWTAHPVVPALAAAKGVES